jgi:hypothetical protein
MWATAPNTAKANTEIANTLRSVPVESDIILTSEERKDRFARAASIAVTCRRAHSPM